MDRSAAGCGGGGGRDAGRAGGGCRLRGDRADRAVNISEPFIRRPVATSLLAVGLFLLGVVAFRFLPVAPLPRVDYPMISVSAQPARGGSRDRGVLGGGAAGAAAGPDRRRDRDSPPPARWAARRITIQFDLNRNIDGAARDVQAAINAAAGDLPLDLPTPPTYRKVNPADSPIMILALTSDTLPPGRRVQIRATTIIGAAAQPGRRA